MPLESVSTTTTFKADVTITTSPKCDSPEASKISYTKRTHRFAYIAGPKKQHASRLLHCRRKKKESQTKNSRM